MITDMMNKENLNAYDEPQCEEIYNEDDHYGVLHPRDEGFCDQEDSVDDEEVWGRW